MRIATLLALVMSVVALSGGLLQVSRLVDSLTFTDATLEAFVARMPLVMLLIGGMTILGVLSAASYVLITKLR